MIGLPGLITSLTAGAETLSRGVLSPVLAYYFPRDRETFTYTLSLWIPRSRRKRVLTAIQGMRRETAGYIRGSCLFPWPWASSLPPACSWWAFRPGWRWAS